MFPLLSSQLFSMSGFGGSVLAMIQSLRNNRALRASKKRGKQGLFDKSPESVREGKPLMYKQATKAEMEAFRIAHAERMRQFRMRKVLAGIVSGVLVILIVVAVNVFFLKADSRKAPETLSHRFSYDQWMYMGEGHMLNQQYDSAAMCFQQALPKSSKTTFIARQQLARAYMLQCAEHGLECDKALPHLNYLIVHFGERVEFLDLRANCYLLMDDSVNAKKDFNRVDELVLNRGY